MTDESIMNTNNMFDRVPTGITDTKTIRLSSQFAALDVLKQLNFQIPSSVQRYINAVSQITAEHQARMNAITGGFARMMQEHQARMSAITSGFARIMQENQKLTSTFSSVLLKSGYSTYMDSILQLQKQILIDLPSIRCVEEGIIIAGELHPWDSTLKTIEEQKLLENPSAWINCPKGLQMILIYLLIFVVDLPKEICYELVVPKIISVFQSNTESPQSILRTVKKEIVSNQSFNSSPFIIQDNIILHANSEKKSRVLARLPFGTEVQILKFRKKKRWVLIEWQENGGLHRGWVLGRYVFRPSKYRRAR